MEAALLQCYYSLAYNSMPIVDLDEIRSRHKTGSPSWLPSYLSRTLMVVGAIASCRMAVPVLSHRRVIELHDHVLGVLLAMVNAAPASIDYITAMVLLLSYRPHAIPEISLRTLVGHISRCMSMLGLLTEPESLPGCQRGSRRLGVVKHLVCLHYFHEVHLTWPGAAYDGGVDLDPQLPVLAIADEDYISTAIYTEESRPVTDDGTIICGLHFNDLMTELTRLRLAAIRLLRRAEAGALSDFVKPPERLHARLPWRLALQTVRLQQPADRACAIAAVLNLAFDSTRMDVHAAVLTSMLARGVALDVAAKCRTATAHLAELFASYEQAVRDQLDVLEYALGAAIAQNCTTPVLESTAAQLARHVEVLRGESGLDGWLSRSQRITIAIHAITRPFTT